MAFRYKLSNTKKRELAEQFEELENFLSQNPQISASTSRDSFYFTIKGKSVRVSNHTIKASNRGAYDEFYNPIRKEYHTENQYDIMITAGKFRLPQIYADLQAGYELDKRGNRKQEVFNV